MKLFLCSFFIASLPLLAFGQKAQYVYTPDSSILSIAMENYRLNAKKSFISLSLKDKWSYAQGDSLSFDFRGILAIEDLGGVTVKHHNAKFTVLGKTIEERLEANNNFIITVVMPLKSVFSNPKIRISTKKLKGKNWFLEVDSIDIRAY